MKQFACLLCVACAAIALSGCARAARDTTGYAITDTVTLPAGFEESWQTVKGVLREMELDLYTRDKRGSFVAYSPMKRHLYITTPHRTQYTITLEDKGSESTLVTIETIEQVYGVTLLTYPDWHDRKAKNNDTALTIIEALKAKTAG